MSKMTDEQIIKALECCISAESCCVCGYTKMCDGTTIHQFALDLINRQQAEIEKLNVELVGMRGACNSYKMHYDNAKTEIERLITIAKKMHSWIFTNSYDEEKAYAECGLTDEENTLLGYCGKIVFESKEMVGEGK